MTHNQIVFQTGHDSRSQIGGGRGNNPIIRILGQISVGAISIHEGSGIAVARRDRNHHIAFQNSFKNFVDVRFLTAKASRRSQAHINCICIQPEAILQRGKNIIKIRAAVHAKYLHYKELCIRSNTHCSTILCSIGRRNTGYMCAVIPLLIIVMGYIQAPIYIVEPIGHLFTAVKIFRRQFHTALIDIPVIGIQGFQCIGYLVKRQRTFRQRRCCCKGRVIHIQARINDCNPHSFSGIPKCLPGLRSTGDRFRFIQCWVGHNTAIGHILRHIVSRRYQNFFHTRQSPNFFQSPIRKLHCHAVHRHMIMVLEGCRIVFCQLSDFLQCRFLLELHRFHLLCHRCTLGRNLRPSEALLQQAPVFQDHNGPHHFRFVIRLLF